MDVPSYAERAIQRWLARGPIRPGRTLQTLHDQRSCPCLVCADGREALGMRPLVPLFARRAAAIPPRARRA